MLYSPLFWDDEDEDDDDDDDDEGDDERGERAVTRGSWWQIRWAGGPEILTFS